MHVGLAMRVRKAAAPGADEPGSLNEEIDLVQNESRRTGRLGGDGRWTSCRTTFDPQHDPVCRAWRYSYQDETVS